MEKILDGKVAAAYVLQKIKDAYSSVHYPTFKPTLAVILVGDDPRSATYVKAKEQMSLRLGFGFKLVTFPSHISQETLVSSIHQLNEDPNVSGIIVQLPLPASIEESAVISAIDIRKDVDGFTQKSLGSLVLGDASGFVSATPLGVMMLIDYYKISTQGKHVVIIGRSNIVGRPLSILLSQKHRLGNATVTVCHAMTPEVQQHTQQADIIVLAIGKAQFLKTEMIKKGAVVIDVGINVLGASDEQKKVIVGDADFDALLPLVSAITPVPGGVGRMTIAGLMFNTFKAFTMQHSFPVNAKTLFSF